MRVTGQEILRQSVFIALLVAMVLGAWYFVFRPRDQADQDMREQIRAKQKQLRKLNRATASIGNLKDEIAELEKAITFFQSKLPNEKEIDRVLEELWRLAEANNLTTKSIYTMGRSSSGTFVPTGGPHAEQPIRMRFEGNYVGFYGFLLALENQPRIMRIRKMTLREAKEGDGRITADVEMSIFFESRSNSEKQPPWRKKA